jgi:hypothetical protein
VSAVRSDPPTLRARAAGRTAQQREQERAAHGKEQRIRRRERLEQYNEEYRLREQQGLCPPPPLENSLSDEKEEIDGGRVVPDKWEPAPPSPQAEGAAVELAPEAGVEPPAVEPSEEVPAGAAEAPVRTMEVPPALDEEEAGILQFEVSSVSPRAPSISRGDG